LFIIEHLSKVSTLLSKVIGLLAYYEFIGYVVKENKFATPKILRTHYRRRRAWPPVQSGVRVGTPSKEREMSNVTESLEGLVELAGARYAALVDSTTGMVLGHAGESAELEIVAAANTEVVRAQLKSMGTLKSTDAIDDIIITLSAHYDIVRPLAANPSIFLYLAMDKNKSNMALARFKVAECDRQLEL
jgi:hypothetical protein